MSRSKNDVYRQIVYTAPETSTLGQKHVEKASSLSRRSLPFFIRGAMSDYFAPLLPGELCFILAQTHHYKTGTINAWETSQVEHMEKQDRKNEVIVHIDLETPIEHLAIREVGKVLSIPANDILQGKVKDMDELKRAALRVGRSPVYRIGASMGRKKVGFDDLYLSNIEGAIEYIIDGIHDGELEIAAIYLDYLQALPYDPEIKRAPTEHQRRLQVRSDVYRLRNMGARLECPVITGVQARQNLQHAPHRNFLLPGSYDGKETSDIAERADRVISQWMPKITHTMGESIEYRSINFVVQENLLWIRFCKQRGGLPSGQSFPCLIDFTSNTIEHEPSLYDGY